MVHRIDDPTAAPTLPAPRPQGTPGYFTGGSPGSGGFLATIVRYEFMNMLQEELANVIEAAALILDKTDNTQLLQALQKMSRLKLFQDTTLYVSPTGFDSNSGLTPATPLATGQAAWNQAVTLDLNGHNLTIQFADGTYTTPIRCSGTVLGLVSQDGVVIQGNIASPDLVVFDVTNGPCVETTNGANVYVKGVTLKASGVGGDYTSAGIGLTVNSGSIKFGHVIFGACQTGHMACLLGQVSSEGNPYTINAPSLTHMSVGEAGYMTITRSAVSIVGNPHFSQMFIQAAGASTVYAGGCAFAGAATGYRYGVSLNAIIVTNTGDENYLPGDLVGVKSTGGQYI